MISWSGSDLSIRFVKPMISDLTIPWANNPNSRRNKEDDGGEAAFLLSLRGVQRRSYPTQYHAHKIGTVPIYYFVSSEM